MDLVHDLTRPPVLDALREKGRSRCPFELDSERALGDNSLLNTLEHLNLFPPFPGDTFVVIGAYLVGIGFLKFDITFLISCAGSILGFMTMYYAGLKFKEKIIERKKSSSRFIKRVNAVQNWFHKYGFKIILINRFLSGARSVVALTAGISKLHAGKVFILSFLSILVWNGLLISGGYLLGENWSVLTDYIKRYNLIVISIIVLSFFIYFIYKRSWRRWFV